MKMKARVQATKEAKEPKEAKEAKEAKLAKVAGSRVMKQAKLSFAVQAKKRILSDPGILTNANKKPKLEQNNNNNKECEEDDISVDVTQNDNTRKNLRSGKSSNKENENPLIIDSDKKQEESSETKEGKLTKSSQTKLEILKEKNDETVSPLADNEDLEENVKEIDKKFSNSMKDAVKTECKICRYGHKLKAALKCTIH